MTAYHGEKLGKNKYYFDHGETLNTSPALIIRTHPPPHGLEGARVVEGPVSPPLVVDVYPTVLYLLDFEVPEGSGARVLETQKYC
jgi:hypothetical protein